MIASTVTFLIIFFVCVVVGSTTGDSYTFGVCIGAGILLGVTGFFIMAEGIDSISKQKKREQRRKQIKAQEDYDNYWGTIDWHDR